ncbi:uncharacterized protein zgc:112980 isoform X3 [Sardina pilchardus]|uniref:uncharacterized protein zgc:112980 isoform X3 n=1 Tax=Sardina pilchardus TaxID=27697 RepID=UPI002E13BAE9
MDSVIILSSSSSEDESDTEPAVFVVEKVPPVLQQVGAVEVVDDDLAITYAQKGAVLPHARSDCPSHPFRETSDDELGNLSFCEQCFCYVCDTLASECQVWSTHCNAHSHCNVWRTQREMRALGILHKLGFTMEDMDQEIRTAESLLQIFSRNLAKHLVAFQQSGHRSMFECVSAFLSKAEQESVKTGAVMMLGAAHLLTHTLPPHSEGSPESSVDPKDDVSEALCLLLHRVFAWLLQVCVDITLSSSVVQKLQRSCAFLNVPTACKTAWLRVQAVRVWDCPLLVSVLKGQNVSGRTKRGKSSVSSLQETGAVVTERVRQLLQQHRYREVARYLKVVQSEKTSAIQELRDLVPLYLCQAGDFQAANEQLFSPIGHTSSWPAARLTPPQLHTYLRVFTTGQAPRPHPSSWQHPMTASRWEPIKGACVLKASLVVKFALRVLHYNKSAFNDVLTWENLLLFVSSQARADGRVELTEYLQPDAQYLTRAHEIIKSILTDLGTSHLQIPKSFIGVYPRQALLLLVTEALAQRISQVGLSPALNVLLNYRVNVWAVRWLYQRLSPDASSLVFLLSATLEDLLTPHPQRLSPEEHIFISDFLCLFFLDGACPVPPNTSLLLANWNESSFPWQYHLRQTLDHWRADLSPDKYNILQRMKAVGTTY